MLRVEAVQEAEGLFIQASVSRSSENVAEPGIFASSLNGEFEEAVKGIYISGPEHS